MNISENHRGPTARTAGRSKHLDACMRLWQDMPAPVHASLAKEMHAPKSWPDACIPCMPQLKVYRLPNRTLINHYSIQMPQSARVKTPCTRQSTHAHATAAAHASLKLRDARAGCTQDRAHASFGSQGCTRTAWCTRQWGVILAYCYQIHLQLGVPLP